MDETIDLVKRARSGDKAAFGALAQQHIGMLIRIAYRMTGDYETAQELAQESILQAYLSLRHLHDEGLFRSWLYGIGVNVCRSFIRTRKVAPLSIEDLMGGMVYHGALEFDSSPTVEEIVESQELHHRILQAVNALTPADREAVLLFYYQEMSIREAAMLLNISPGALRVRLHKARKALRESLLSSPLISEGLKEDRKMIPVEVLEIMVMAFDDGEPPNLQHPIILLLDETHERILPIWIGSYEAQNIQMILQQSPVLRPMTWSFMGNVLGAVGAQVESVTVNKLVGEVYYAIVKLRMGGSVHEIDARPSDAIGLALTVQAPIFVAEEIFNQTGVRIGEQYKASLAQKKRMSRLTPEEAAKLFPPPQVPAEVKQLTQEEIEEANKKTRQRMEAIIGQ